MNSQRVVGLQSVMESEVQTPGKESLSNRTDELAHQSEGKKPEAKAFLFHTLSCRLSPEDMIQFRVVSMTLDNLDLGWVFPPQMRKSRKSFTRKGWGCRLIVSWERWPFNSLAKYAKTK